MAPLKALLVGLSLIVSRAHSLYFYIDGTNSKCFYEELARDTLVVGMQLKNSERYTV